MAGLRNLNPDKIALVVAILIALFFLILTVFAAPTINSVVLNSTTGANLTNESLTAYVDSSDSDTNIFVWKLNGDSFAALHYPFDNNVSDYSSALVKDYSTNENNGTLGAGSSSASPTWNATGAIGGCYDFDGSNDWIETGASATDLGIEGLASRTFCIWAMTREFSTSGAFEVGSYVDQGGQLFTLITTTTLDRWQMQFYNTSANTNFDVPNSLNNWIHFCFSYNGSTAAAYVNGTFATSVDTTNRLGTQHDIRFGRYGTYFFNGSLDDFRVYNRALSQEQVNQIYLETKYNYLTNSTIVSNETDHTDVWSVEVYPLNSTFEGTAVSSDNLTIPDSNPRTIVPSINSTNGTNHYLQDLNCFLELDDQDGDDLNVTVNWYKDYILESTEYHNNSYSNGTDFVATLAAGNTTPDDYWSCSVQLTDGTNYSSFKSSEALQILNSVPTTVSAVVIPSEALENQTLEGYCNGTESDDENITYYYSWYKNSKLNSTGYSSGHSSGQQINVANLTSGNLSEGEEWSLRCLVGDDYENATSQKGDYSKIYSITRPRAQPKINATRFNTTEDLEGLCKAVDPNGDTINFTYAWYRNGELNFTGTDNGDYPEGTTVSLSNLSAGNTSQGDWWSFSCNATDGTESSTEMYHIYINNYDTYFIDAISGSDSSDGLHPDSAWQTLNQINSASFDPGEAILLKRNERFDMIDGQCLINSNGNTTDRIIYGAYGFGHKPVIEGINAESAYTRVASDYLLFQNWRIENTPSFGLIVEASGTWIEGNIYEYLDFYNNNRGGIHQSRFQGINNSIIRHCTFEHIGYPSAGSAITIMGNADRHSSNILVYNNTMTDVNGDMMTLHEGSSHYLQYAGTNISIFNNIFNGSQSGDCMDLTTGSEVKFYNNTLANCSANVIHLSHSFHNSEIFHNTIYSGPGSPTVMLRVQDIKFWGNVIYGGGGAGVLIAIGDEKQFTWDLDQNNSQVYRNTIIWDGETYDIHIYQDSNNVGEYLEEIHLYDNILTTAQASMPSPTINFFDISEYGPDSANFTCDGNLYGPGTASFTSVSSFSEWQSTYGHDLNGLNDVDPKILDIGNEDLNLHYLSPAIDAGTGQYHRDDDLDFYGNPIYGQPDIGAIEYQPPYMMGTDHINHTSSIRIYGDGKFRYLTNISEGTIEVNLSVYPQAGWTSYNATQTRPEWMNLTVHNWTSTYMNWTEEASGFSDTNHTIGGLTASSNYTVYVDTVPYDNYLSDALGVINFTYNGTYSEKNFEIQPTASENVTTISALFLPNPANTTDNLEAYCTGTGPEGCDMTYYYEIYNGTNLFTSGQSANYSINQRVNVYNLSSSNTSKGENWTLSCLASNSTSNATNWLNDSVTIQNSIPSASSRISPTTAYTANNLQGYCTGTDADNDNLTYYYQWYLDGNLSLSNSSSNNTSGIEVLLSTIPSSNTSVGQTWTFSCFADDDSTNSSTSNTSITISQTQTTPPGGPGSPGGSSPGGTFVPATNETEEEEQEWPLKVDLAWMTITRNYDYTTVANQTKTYILETIEFKKGLENITYNITIPAGFGEKLTDITITGPKHTVTEATRTIHFTISGAEKGSKVIIRFTVDEEIDEEEIQQILLSMSKPRTTYDVPDVSAEPLPVCGNGVVEEGEECDGDSQPGYLCLPNCTLQPLEGEIDIAAPASSTITPLLAAMALAILIGAYFVASRGLYKGKYRQLQTTLNLPPLRQALMPRPPEVRREPAPEPRPAKGPMRIPAAPAPSKVPKPVTLESVKVELDLGHMKDVTIGGNSYKIKLLELHDEDVLIFVLTTVSSIHLKLGKPELVDLDDDGKKETEVLATRPQEGGKLVVEFRKPTD